MDSKASYDDGNDNFSNYLNKTVSECTERDLLIRHDERLTYLTMRINEAIIKQNKKMDSLEMKFWGIVFVLVTATITSAFL